MYPFEYHRPASIADVGDILASQPDARLLAGGMSLLPAMKLRLASPSLLVDLASVPDMKGVFLDEASITIGAMTRHVDVAQSPQVAVAFPGLASLAGGIGDRQVRNRGTIGGSVANNDPAACYPAALLSLGATVRTNKRDISSDEFFRGMFETALTRDEFVVSVTFPFASACAYVKFCQPASRFALVGVFVAVALDGTVRVAVTGAGASVFRCIELERALNDQLSARSAETASVAPDGLSHDLHASSAYRAALIPVLAGRAVNRLGAVTGRAEMGGI